MEDRVQIFYQEMFRMELGQSANKIMAWKLDPTQLI